MSYVRKKICTWTLFAVNVEITTDVFVMISSVSKLLRHHNTFEKDYIINRESLSIQSLDCAP